MEFAAKISVIETVLGKMASGDVADLGRYVHEDFVLYEDPGMPYGGVYRGVQGFLEVVANVMAAWPDLKTETLSQLDEPGGSGVATVMKISSSNGAEGHIFEFWRFEDGKFREGRVCYYDTPKLSAAVTRG